MVLEILSTIFSFYNLLIITFGCLFGVMLGCIPGLNGGIGITLLLPLSFTMPPASALLLLGGIFMGSSYGGSISAILLNVPGTSEAYCTSLDGYPMARNKRGKEALYYAVLASCIGGFIGVFVLIAFSPVLADFALRFGPPEYFLVGCVGLTVVGGLAGKNFFKGIAAVCIGLILGMIGFDTVTGALRLTYGSKKLIGGIELMPVILGLFALTEMLLQINEVRHNKTTKRNTDSGIQDLGKMSLGAAVVNCFRNKLILLKSSLIGTLIGALPGPGAAISSFLAYGEVKRSAIDDEIPVGEGNYKGILAAEAANNAAVGGGFVPMLSLGIPGTPTAAVIYGAMIIHGLQPGPRLFVDTPVIAYTFSYGMLLSVLLMGVVGIFCVPFFTKILKLDIKYIIVPVILCSILGAFSIRNSMFDVFVAIVFGFLGVLFHKFSIPTSPIVLGIILSGLIEKNFRLSITMAAAKHVGLFRFTFTRPLCLVILAVGILLVFLNIRSMQKEKKYKKEIK